MIMKLSDLPKLGAPLGAGKFVGVITLPSGVHVAVELLPERSSDLTWQAAMDWAKQLDGELPTRPAAAMLFANAKAALPRGWHWTNEDDASYAWDCYFGHGGQRYEGRAVAVRYHTPEAA